MQILNFLVCGSNLHIRAKFERLHRYSEFSTSNMAAVRHLEFWKCANFNILHGLQPESTKFRHYRLNGCGNIANFRETGYIKVS